MSNNSIYHRKIRDSKVKQHDQYLWFV